MVFFDLLKSLREETHLSISEISKKLKIAEGKYKGYEFKKASPSFDILIKIADLFEVSIDYLIIGDKAKFIKNIIFFQYAKEIDEVSHLDSHKLEVYLDTLLDNRKKIYRKYDEHTHNFNKDFNHNFTELVKQSKLIGRKFADRIDVTERQISSYKKSSECSYDTLIKISNAFNVSIHWLITGQKLNFKFNDHRLEKQIFQADQYLEKKYINVAVDLIKKIIKNK